MLVRLARVIEAGQGVGHRSQQSAAPSATAEPRRGKLSEASLREHLARHPLDKRNSDRSRFTDGQRIKALSREQAVEITRTALVKRLLKCRASATS